jgi:hypothetical protein
MRIRTERLPGAPAGNDVARDRPGRRDSLDFNAEPFGVPTYRLVVQFRAVALLEHGQRRLLAAYFGGKRTLGKPGFAPRIPEPETYVWIEIRHVAYYPISRMPFQQAIINNYQQVYKLINPC